MGRGARMGRTVEVGYGGAPLWTRDQVGNDHGGRIRWRMSIVVGLGGAGHYYGGGVWLGYRTVRHGLLL